MPPRCCLPHPAGVGAQLTPSSSSSRPLPDLLGLSEEQLLKQMEQWHPYAFNMGHGKTIPFKDYQEAAQVLKEKNKNLAYEELDFLEMRKGREDITNAAGDFVEKELSDALKKYYEKAKVVILQGPTLRKGKGKVQENDFVIVDYERKVIICIESKATLNGTTGQKAVKQTLELKKLLEEYFASELASGEWAFVGMIFTNNIKKSICQACAPFVIQGCSEVATKLALIEDHLKPIRKQCSPNHTEYASLVRGLVFVVWS